MPQRRRRESPAPGQEGYTAPLHRPGSLDHQEWDEPAGEGPPPDEQEDYCPGRRRYPWEDYCEWHTFHRTAEAVETHLRAFLSFHGARSFVNTFGVDVVNEAIAQVEDPKSPALRNPAGFLRWLAKDIAAERQAGGAP